MAREDEIHIIKKYPNRRLYDTWSSRYITLTDVAEMIRDGEDIQVLDTQTNNDLTRSILVQIIVEQETGSEPLFTKDMLTEFIRSHDDTSRALFTQFFEQNMEWFKTQQDNFKDQMGQMMTTDPMRTMNEMAEKNLEIWQEMQDSFFESTGMKRKK